jgi:DNA-binding NarL/FixJ family response regulator
LSPYNNIAVKLVEKVTSKENNANLFNETEKEIIPLIIRGLSNKEISTIINISYGTTRNYISEIYRKIGQNERNIAIEKLKEYVVEN